MDGVDLDIYRGQTLGIVGESGCGKSVTAQSIMRIVPSPPSRIVGGRISLYSREDEGTIDLTSLSPMGPQIRALRGKEMAMIFQEPMNSLSPVHTIGNQIMESILLHQKGVTKAQARDLVIALLKRVGISKPEQRVDEYSYQLSGGMRQRAMIAIALSCNPSLLIADEPTTALDVTVQAQILTLLKGLQRDYGMAVMLITHDLAVISEMAHTVVVMYFGKVMETASVEGLFYGPLHPYTRALLQSIPSVEKKSGGRLALIEGFVPEPYTHITGCAFAPRCMEHDERECKPDEEPPFVEVGKGHMVRCFLYGK